MCTQHLTADQSAFFLTPELQMGFLQDLLLLKENPFRYLQKFYNHDPAHPSLAVYFYCCRYLPLSYTPT